MKFSNLGRLAVGLFLALFGACFLPGSYARPKPPAPGYHLLKTVSLPAAPGGGEYYDYISVDAVARRVYVSHGTEVVVLNADDYSVVGNIGGCRAPMGSLWPGTWGRDSSRMVIPGKAPRCRKW